MNDRLGQPPEAMQRREDIAAIVAVSYAYIGRHSLHAAHLGCSTASSVSFVVVKDLANLIS